MDQMVVYLCYFTWLDMQVCSLASSAALLSCAEGHEDVQVPGELEDDCFGEDLKLRVVV